MKIKKSCPACGEEIECYRNPFPTVDIIIEIKERGIVLIMRKNAPRGWALPGGFVDYGESLEAAAIREAREETGLDIAILGQLHTYSKPDRDPRHHTISTVFVATAAGIPVGADDAREAVIFKEDDLPRTLMFDHAEILKDYFQVKRGQGACLF